MISIHEEEQLIKKLSEMAPLDFKRIIDQVEVNRRIIDSNPRGIGFLQWPPHSGRTRKQKKV